MPPEIAQQQADDAAQAAQRMLDSLEASADEDTAQAQATTQAPTVKTFTREDVNKARQQEKDKLYPELQELRKEVAELRKAREDAEAERQSNLQKEEAAAKIKAEEEMDVRALLAKKELEFQEQIAAERSERERAFALFDKERQFADIQNYRAQQLDAARDDILPELLDLVSGNTREQIDSSVQGLKDRSARILNATAQANQQIRRESSGARVTSPPAADPLDNYSGNKTFTPEELRAMSVEEYAQYRSALLGPGAGVGVGLFG
jgi:hypothetical protein